MLFGCEASKLGNKRPATEVAELALTRIHVCRWFPQWQDCIAYHSNNLHSRDPPPAWLSRDGHCIPFRVISSTHYPAWHLKRWWSSTIAQNFTNDYKFTRGPIRHHDQSSSRESCEEGRQNTEYYVWTPCPRRKKTSYPVNCIWHMLESGHIPSINELTDDDNGKIIDEFCENVSIYGANLEDHQQAGKLKLAFVKFPPSLISVGIVKCTRSSKNIFRWHSSNPMDRC